MVCDGVTNNNAAFSAILGTLTNGGITQLPCGVCKITGAFSLSIGAGHHVALTGSGVDCTELYFSGTSTGLTATLGSSGNNLSSFELRDMAVTTDDGTGANTAITLTSSAPTGVVAQNFFVNLVFRGHDGYGAGDYWGTAVTINTADDVTFDRTEFVGNANLVGNGINVTSTSRTRYAAIINISNSNFFECNKAVIYGNYVQQISLVSSNVVDCKYGVYLPASENYLDGLTIVNSTFEASIDSLYIATNVPNTLISNSYFMIPDSATGITFQATANQVILTGNLFGGVNTTNDVGIAFDSFAGANNIINGNVFENLEYAIAANAAQEVLIVNNQFTTLGYYQTIPYGSMIAYGNTPEVAYTISSLPTCNANTYGIRAVIDNGISSPSYHGAVSTTGSTWAPVWCAPSSASWVYD